MCRAALDYSLNEKEIDSSLSERELRVNLSWTVSKEGNVVLDERFEVITVFHHKLHDIRTMRQVLFTWAFQLVTQRTEQTVSTQINSAR